MNLSALICPICNTNPTFIHNQFFDECSCGQLIVSNNSHDSLYVYLFVHNAISNRLGFKNVYPEIKIFKDLYIYVIRGEFHDLNFEIDFNKNTLNMSMQEKINYLFKFKQKYKNLSSFL